MDCLISVREKRRGYGVGEGTRVRMEGEKIKVAMNYSQMVDSIVTIFLNFLPCMNFCSRSYTDEVLPLFF